MEKQEGKLPFASDYMHAAHPAIMKRLAETNLLAAPGYGTDGFSRSARERLRCACQTPEAEIHFLVGGTQTNAVMIDAFLRPVQGVVAAQSGHISTHEAGAIERGGHKVLTLPHRFGKLDAGELERFLNEWEQDENRSHMVMPGMVYLSQPTEYGTLYSLDELERISRVCRKRGLPLYVDGARLAYALACPENDVTLPALAALCDAFSIGGTKCGALFGEAVVIPQRDRLPHLFTLIKQHGALLAKGWLAGIQFDTLFTEDLYLSIGAHALREAERIRSAMEQQGYALAVPSPTNQLFPVLEGERLERLTQRVELSFWERLGQERCVFRLATSWATRPEETDALLALL